jgi:hypothetical protein
MALGAGVEVAVRGERLIVRGQMPIPAVRRGLPLHPEADDPDAFPIELSALKLGTSPVVCGRGPGDEVSALHLNLVPMSLLSAPRRETRARGVTGALVAGATAIAVRRRR